MTYKITAYSYKKAKQAGVSIKNSTSINKKIDVFKNNEKIASIGAVGYMDYPTYIEKYDKAYADDRRRLYKARNPKTDTPNRYYADLLLW